MKFFTSKKTHNPFCKQTLYTISFMLLSLAFFAQTTYYSKSTGNLNALATWGLNTDGTGAAPANFTTASRTYIITNRTTATIAAAWTVSGAGSRIQVGDGVTGVNFTIPTGFAFNGTADVTNTSTLTILNTTIPTMGSLATGSTVDYARAGNQTIRNATYYNLTCSGSGLKTLSNTTNTSILNNLTINTGLRFRLNTVNTLTCTLSGSVTGTGGIYGGTTSNLTINGTGNLGTLTFSTVLSLYRLTIDRGGLGSITLGSNLTVLNAFNHINGTLDLGGRLLTLSNLITFPVSSTNGLIRGSSTSSLTISGTGVITNPLLMDQTSSLTRTLGQFILNRTGQTLILGNDLIIGARMTHTAGLINLNASLLSLNGIITFPTTVTNGSFIGATTSSISIGGSGTITNSLFMNQGSLATRTLHSLTLNRTGVALRLGNNLISSGQFIHVNGTLTIGTTSLTLSGNITFPVSATNGVITGATTSSLTIDGTGTISNSLFMTQTSTTTRTFNTFIFNRTGQTAVLGNNMIVSARFTHTAGNLGLGSTLLTLNGIITFPASATNGAFIGSNTASLSIAGTGAITNSMYMDQTSITARAMSAVTLNRIGQTLTLGNPLNLINTLTPTNGTFASAGNLRLVASSASVVARIAAIGTSASVTGNITAETFASAGNTGWTLLGTAGITGRTMADWNDDFAITCASCPNGSSVAGSPFTSITTYNEAAGGTFDAAARYIDITSITDPISIAKGYWVYLGNATTTTSNIIFDVVGPVNQGSFLINLSYTAGGGGSASDWGYNLIANPYPSPISWSSLRNGNTRVANAIYVYNPDLGGYSSYVAGVSSPAVGSGGIGNIIPAGQGFYVKLSAATSLTAREANKVAGTQVLLRTNQTETQKQLIRIKATGAGMNNETAIYFDSNAHSYYENELDAMALGVDPGMLNVVSTINDTNYAINGVEALTQNRSIPIRITTGTTGTYQIFADDFQNIPAGACLMLHDNLTNSNHDLRTGPYSCTISNTETTPRFSLDISINNDITVTASATNPSCAKATDGIIIANVSNAGAYDYYWKDSSNQTVRVSYAKTTPDTLTDLTVGNYKVEVTTTGSCRNGSQSFNLESQTGTTVMFSPSSITTNITNDSAVVNFTNNSINADSYWWIFGDGNESSDENPMNVYTQPGEYPVTLLAYNSNCGDTVEYTSMIYITNDVTVGIQDIQKSSTNLFISRDKGGYYVKLNYTEPTNATISVWNILGEKVTKDLMISNGTDNKVYIPLGDSENKLLIINATSEKGDRAYRKLVNE